MTWILIMVIGWYSGPTSQQIVGYSSKEACVTAAKQIKKDMDVSAFYYSCTPDPESKE